MFLTVPHCCWRSQGMPGDNTIARGGVNYKSNLKLGTLLDKYCSYKYESFVQKHVAISFFLW